MKVSVIIVTLNRPDCVRTCLNCLQEQDPRVDQVVLVDASLDDSTSDVVREFPEVQYLRTDVGYGHMTKSRNLGLSKAFGDVIVFLDDDAFPHPNWLRTLISPYCDPTVGGVGGRALNNQAGESITGIDEIGRIWPSGRITGFFAADPGKVIEVDHLIGCNMSWRRSVLEEMGGLRDDYPGTEVREETDIAIRVRKLGYKLLFQPSAIVTHVGAPQAKGRRFDVRYAYYHAHNHAMLITRNFGLKPITCRSALREIRESVVDFFKKQAGALGHFFARIIGLCLGTLRGIILLANERTNPIRRK
jgi:GT2 family glycosyltransferase